LDVKLLAVVIGIVSGAIGYWFTTFSMQPILRFRNLRHQVLKDFIYYAQVVNADNLNDEMKVLYRERVLSNRKISAQLSASLLDLPFWYRGVLKLRGYDIKGAASNLIGYSNTTEYDAAAQKQATIRKKLGLPEET